MNGKLQILNTKKIRIPILEIRTEHEN